MKALAMQRTARREFINKSRQNYGFELYLKGCGYGHITPSSLGSLITFKNADDIEIIKSNRSIFFSGLVYFEFGSMKDGTQALSGCVWE